MKWILLVTIYVAGVPDPQVTSFEPTFFLNECLAHQERIERKYEYLVRREKIKLYTQCKRVERTDETR